MLRRGCTCMNHLVFVATEVFSLLPVHDVKSLRHNTDIMLLANLHLGFRYDCISLKHCELRLLI
jgi:hypothetical protein